MKIGLQDVAPLMDSPQHFCGVYGIVNAATKQSYIGSSISVGARFNQHRRQLNDPMRRGLSHTNRALQEDWDIYGEDVFDFVLLEACGSSELLIREQAWLDFIGADYLYNKNKASGTGRAIDPGLLQDVWELKKAGCTVNAIAKLTGMTMRETVRVLAVLGSGEQ